MDNISAVYFFRQLNDIYHETNTELRSRVFSIWSLLSELADLYVSEEKEVFTGNYAKMHFMLNKTGLINEPEGLEIIKFGKFYRILDKNRNLTCRKNDFLKAFSLTAGLIAIVCKVDIPDEIKTLITGKQEGFSFSIFKPTQASSVNEIELIILEKTGSEISEKGNKVIFQTLPDENLPELLELRAIWFSIGDILRKNSRLRIIDPVILDDRIIASTGSIVILEPDILYDATELSECFQNSGSNPHLYFLKLFTDSKVSFPMVNGNIVNTLFDELIRNPQIDFDEAFNKALKQKPLSIPTVAKNENINKTLDRISFFVKPHFDNLKDLVSEFDKGFLSVEPTFISSKFGLQGRLDLLIESGETQKDIIELKSGKPPKANLTTVIKNKRVPIGIWRNHLAQTTIYNILLDSAYTDRTGNSAILYSSDPVNPLRNSINSLLHKQEVILLRNIILSYELMLSEGNYNIIKKMTPQHFGILPPFSKEELERFYINYSSLDKTSKMYFKLFISFIFREIFTQRTGRADSSSSFGQASLWSMSIEEKSSKFALLKDIEIIPESSDLQKQHLIFKINDRTGVTVYRKGDNVILYPEKAEGSDPLKDQIIKCVIKDISANFVKISLRNKISNNDLFLNFKKWIIEPDYNLATLKKQLKSLYAFIDSTDIKRNELLGLKEPSFSVKNIDRNTYSYLNKTQFEILKQAAAAEDYFLIQGPPGTGKTSYMLKSIVHYLLENTDQTILLAAYTNKAVDEICTAVKKITGTNNIIRLGSKESSIHQDILISHFAEKNDLFSLQQKIRNSRIVISTTSSLIQNSEIFDLKSFDIAIIDEASQILEPQIIGILTKVKRHILIGDEKQLPAIVTQHNNMNVKSEHLQKILLDDPSVSYFERILKLCIKNNWTNAFGMLRNQARMHKDIQDFPSKYFYDGKLTVFDLQKQTNESNIFGKSRKYPYFSNSRVSFVSSNNEFTSKLNKSEANLISELVSEIYELKKSNFDKSTIGIITPFRAQCALIRQNLPDILRELIDVDTVERFQGSEKEFIIYSFAVNHVHALKQIINTARINGSLIDRKFNVAITRAKEYLIITGNEMILDEFPIFKSFIDYAKEKKAYFRYKDIIS